MDKPSRVLCPNAGHELETSIAVTSSGNSHIVIITALYKIQLCIFDLLCSYFTLYRSLYKLWLHICCYIVFSMNMTPLIMRNHMCIRNSYSTHIRNPYAILIISYSANALWRRPREPGYTLTYSVRLMVVNCKLVHKFY
jgi:hypothetical protein